MELSGTGQAKTSGFRFPALFAVAVALSVFALTWVAISQSRKDSYELLRLQGVAFTEALANASSNAIAAEGFFDYLIQQRYTDLVTSLTEENLNIISSAELVRMAQAHDLFAIYIFDSTGNQVQGASARGPLQPAPDYVITEVAQLLAEPEAGFVLLTDQAPGQVDVTHFYLELTSVMDRVIVLVCDALYYDEAIRQTGIGYLAQRMAQEQGVEYIIYQSTEGIIFSSTGIGRLLSIESDSFLVAALESDTIVSRQFEFQGETVLELVRPFSTRRFEFGLFRVGLSLSGYHAVSRGLVIQMVILSAVLFSLLLVILLYLNSRQKRRELRREYHRIKSVTDRIFEQMQTGVAAVDAAGMVRLANHAFLEIFGLSDPVGKSWLTVIPDERLSLTEFVASDTRADEDEIAIVVGNADKTILIVRSKLGGEGSADPWVVMVANDITRLKEYEAITARREWLSELGNLAAGVAHEIRNPLNTISIAAQRLAAEFEPRGNAEEYRSFTENIRTETKRLNEIITRFLSLSRVEQKKQTKVRLDEVVTEATDLLKVEADRLDIELDVTVADGLLVVADPDKLKQIIQNLFNNAKEAMDGRTGKIVVKADSADGQVRMTFGDNGPGIPPELRTKVFTPYFTTKEAGTGLGLATVHQMMTEIGGDVSVGESELGGVRVELVFPSVDSQA